MRRILDHLSADLTASEVPLDAQNMANGLFGLQNMTSKHSSVRKIMKALSSAILRSLPSQPLPPLDSDPEASGLRNGSKAEIPSISSSVFTGQAVGNSFYGLQGMSSEVPETRLLLRALCRQLREMPSLAQLRAWRNQSLAALDDYLLSGQHIGNAFWGFKNMDSRTAEVLEALDLLALKTRESVAVMDGQNFANALYALHAMDGEKPAVRAALTALAHKLVATNRPFSGLDIGDCFPWLCLEYRHYGKP